MYNLDNTSRNIVRTFIELPPDNRKVIEGFIDSIMSYKSMKDEIDDEFATNYSKLSEKSKNDLSNYLKTLLMNEKFEQMNINKINDNVNI